MSNLVLSKSRFVHIPKCAGTFLQSALYFARVEVRETYSTPHSGHLCLHQMPETDHFNFTFIRHPYTWWPSYYYYMHRTWEAEGRTVTPFDVWLHDAGPFWLGHYTALVKRFTGVDELYPTKNKMNFIGKSENIEKDLYQALKQAEEYFNEGRYSTIFAEKPAKVYDWVNTQNYNREISDSSKDLIYRGEKWVFDTFGYSKTI